MDAARRDDHLDDQLDDLDGVDDGRISRRALLGGLGVLGVAGLAGAAIEGPPLVRRIQRHYRRNSVGVRVPVPAASVPVVSRSFRSDARGRNVHLRVAVPPSLAGATEVPVCVWLHGRGNTSATVFDGLKAQHFLAAAVAEGVAPFAIAAVDGGETYWHRRRSGDDPERMILEELPAQLASAGVRPGRWAIAGWSMGGYGALLLAERHDRFAAVAASSPAVWFHAGDTRPGAFDSREDFQSHDVLGGLTSLPPAVRVDCGNDDPFAVSARALLDRVPGITGGFAAGAHTMRFWRSVLPAQLRFLGAALAA